MLRLGKALVIFMVVVLLSTPALFACGKKEEAKPQASAGGPSAMMPGQTGGPMMAQGQKAGEGSSHGMGMPGGAKVERKVVVPKEVAGQWKGVKITVIDKKSGGKSNTYTLNLNESFTVPGSKLMLKVDAFLPNFSMSGDAITSASNEPRNPACHLVLLEGGKESKNWLFANFPDMHPIDHPQYKIILLAGVPKG